MDAARVIASIVATRLGLEDHKRHGVFFACMTVFFSVQFLGRIKHSKFSL